MIGNDFPVQTLKRYTVIIYVLCMQVHTQKILGQISLQRSQFPRKVLPKIGLKLIPVKLHPLSTFFPIWEIWKPIQETRRFSLCLGR